ncbi:MAG: hypothetical protein WBC70_06985 [Candidatus Aminicenantales bacterium]
MAKLKRIVEVGFLAVAAVVLLAHLINIYLGWRHGKNIDKEILKGARVAVVKTVPQFPPAFLIEYENSGRLPIAKTHFRLTIELDAVEVARSDRDYGEIRAGKTERLLLQTSPSASPAPAIAPGARLSYRLLAFPNNKKPLPELVGEIVVQ